LDIPNLQPKLVKSNPLIATGDGATHYPVYDIGTYRLQHGALAAAMKLREIRAEGRRQHEWRQLTTDKMKDPASAAAPTAPDVEKLATAFDGAENKAPDATAQENNGEDKTAKTKKKKPDAGARTQAEKLIALASEAQLFHAADGTPYADISVNGHRETWRLYSTGFCRWLKRRYHETERDGGAPNAESMAAALGMLEAHAHYDGPEREVHIRVGGIDGKVYLDLCDPSWRAVEIDENGWQIIDAPPVRFRRTSGMKPLPLPWRGGSVDGLIPTA
jgi:hypothetical protein